MSLNRSQCRRNDRILQQAGRRYNRLGCARCGGNGATSVADVLTDGTPICRACRAPDDEPRFIGGIVGITQVSDGQDSDRRWFEQNPGKAWRLRPLLHMERDEILARDEYTALAFSGGPRPACVLGYDERMATSVFTYQIAPGQRLRVLCTPPADPVTAAAWAEEIALPEARRRIAVSRPAIGRPTPDHLLAATNAIGLAHLPGFETLFEKAKEQGLAMAEARRNTRQ